MIITEESRPSAAKEQPSGGLGIPAGEGSTSVSSIYIVMGYLSSQRSVMETVRVFFSLESKMSVTSKPVQPISPEWLSFRKSPGLFCRKKVRTCGWCIPHSSDLNDRG